MPERTSDKKVTQRSVSRAPRAASDTTVHPVIAKKPAARVTRAAVSKPTQGGSAPATTPATSRKPAATKPKAALIPPTSRGTDRPKPPVRSAKAAGSDDATKPVVSRASRPKGAPKPSASRRDLSEKLVQDHSAANGPAGSSATPAERLADDLRAYVAAASESLASALPLIALIPDDSPDAKRVEAGERFTHAGQAMAAANAALWQSWAGLVMSPASAPTETPPR